MQQKGFFCKKSKLKSAFFEKKLRKSLVVSEKAVPIQPHLEKCSYQMDFTAEIAQLVEHDLAKVGVAGSSPVFRSTF